MKKKISPIFLRTLLSFGRLHNWVGAVVVSVFCLIGVVVLLSASAAPIALSQEPENGTVTVPATVIADATASGGKAVKFGAAIPTTDSSNIYRPIKITDPLQLPHTPKDAHYVMWNFPAGTMLQDAFNTLGPNDILVLPERAQPYEIDSSKGFVSDATRYFEMARAKRGLVGLGPGVIVEPSASSFTLPLSTSTEGNLNHVLSTDTAGSYLGNFEMRGRTFGQAAYDATQQEGNNAVWERIYFNGAHRGWKNSPPGETGAISGYKGSNQQVYNVEVDCRDPATGARVGTSPFMFNAQSDVRIDDFYGHHSLAGMPTFWRVTNITTNRLRSEYNGSGSGSHSGSGINHELVGGTVIHNDPKIIIDYVSNGGKNTGLHMSIGTNATTATYYINRPTFDAGPAGPGIFTIQFAPSDYPGQDTSSGYIHVTNASGGSVPFRTYN